MDRPDARDVLIPEPPPLSSATNAARFGLIGAGAALSAAVLGLADLGEWIAPIRVILVVVGMIIAGIGITLNYQSKSGWLLAALTCGIGAVGFPESWDTFRLVARVFAGIALVGAGLLTLPPQWRMRVGGCLATVHFGMIFLAVTSPPPASALTTSLWSVVGRPYLQFAYLNNAYQFYSPDPGPASEAWFCINYEPKVDDKVKMEVLQLGADGKAARDKNGNLVYKPMTDEQGNLTGEPIYDAAGNFIFVERKDEAGHVLKRPVYVGDEQKPDYIPIVRWVKIPKHNRDFKDPLGQAYYRRLSLSEQITHITPLSQYPLSVQTALTNRRQLRAADIPLDLLEWPMPVQCRIPNHDITEFILPSYVRYIARQNDTAERPVASMKIYRVMHVITAPENFKGSYFKGRKVPIPLSDPITYYPYYLGEYSPKGELLNPNDPLLYWLIPIRRNPNATPDDFINFYKTGKAPTLAEYKRLYEDFVAKHAESHHMEGELEK